MAVDNKPRVRVEYRSGSDSGQVTHIHLWGGRLRELVMEKVDGKNVLIIHGADEIEALMNALKGAEYYLCRDGVKTLVQNNTPEAKQAVEQPVVSTVAPKSDEPEYSEEPEEDHHLF